MGRGCLGVIVLGVLAVVVISLLPATPDPETRRLNAGIEAKQPQCRKNLAQLMDNGTIGRIQESDVGSTIRGVVAFYDERVWNRLDYDDRVRQGLLVYCAKRPIGFSGRFTAHISSRRDGHKLGAIVDGSWQNP